ncbi:MAG: sugar phosphatase of the superfamily protein [Candidatus Midichloriaceae bacterium]|jgi:HAD superfamily hydrolase (TIGR01459 family)|nr:sugar phosphatase of the superfamily protein [Candidatus Midichloriaceae bacterium]
MLDKIINTYQTFILDIWGVLHDGEALLPGVEHFINALKLKKKNFFLLSNSPRPVKSVHTKLTSLGLNIPDNNIFTSGQFFIEALANPSITSINLTGKAFIIGADRHTELVASSRVLASESLQNSSYILMLAFTNNLDEIPRYTEVFKQAIASGLPMLCINPDKTVIHAGSRNYCQGQFASFYESLGGKVFYFGKPYVEIYEYLFKKYGLTKDKAIMIGDSLDTDICGAKNFGIDSALLLTGIYKDETDVANLLNLSTNVPSYILNNLVDTHEQNNSTRLTY